MLTTYVIKTKFSARSRECRRDVAAPTLLWYGEADTPCPPAHGRWYADRIADSKLVMIPGAGHLDVIDGHWPEVLTGLLTIWKQGWPS